MNGKQLQIGNWVSFSNKPYKVTKVLLDYDDYLIDLELNFIYDVPDEDVEPIPLTVDILHKSNIFSNEDHNNYILDGYASKTIRYKIDNYAFDIIVDKDCIWLGYDEYFIKRLNYVHELQNIFSLYNIDIDVII